MANVDGKWDTVTKSPLGDQKAVLTVVSDGGSFTGSFVGAMGNAEVQKGAVNGDKLSWEVDVNVPMSLHLTGEATVDGDTLTGTVKAGVFGSFPFSGTRIAE